VAEHPRRPTSMEPKDLTFAPVEQMTPWLSPRQLVRTALNVVLSKVFGSYSDKREIQASVEATPPLESFEADDEIWIDFVADLGDGFGPTYTIASLLAGETLELNVPGQGPVTTKRGRALVMGGDEVYPTASEREYENKTVGPYRAALPWFEPNDDAPHLYVVPGNHDWYDGLTAFMRIFCRQQWIGGWRTKQARSYFAVQLPNRWWLWGIDIQFDSYIDQPQFEYFQEVVLQAGDSVILCTAVPSWAHAAEEDGAEAYATLDYLERKIVREKGAEVRLALTGDAHHYARYAQDGIGQTDGAAAQKITAGGGGAFLSATHHLPADLTLPPTASRSLGKSSPPTEWELEHTFPSAPESKRLRWRVVRLPFENPGMWAFMGGAHVVYSWMAQSTHRRPGERFHDVVARMSFDDIVRGLGRSPLAIIVTAGLVRGMVGFTKSKAASKKWGLGLGHSAAQLGAIFLSTGAAAGICTALGLSGLGYSAGFVVLVGVGGGLLGCAVLAGYLLVADKSGLNANELFSAQRNRDWKNFMRLHLARDGTLTVYPIGVRTTPRKWKLRVGGEADDPWFVPRDGPEVAELTDLIEGPIRIQPTEPDAAEAAPNTPARSTS